MILSLKMTDKCKKFKIEIVLMVLIVLIEDSNVQAKNCGSTEGSEWAVKSTEKNAFFNKKKQFESFIT